MKSILLIFAGLISLSQTQSTGLFSNASSRCTQLGASLNIENVTVNFAEYVTNGTVIPLSQDYNLSSCGYVSQLVSGDMCRLAMYVSTSNRSGISEKIEGEKCG
jgi:feruloyl esterase